MSETVSETVSEIYNNKGSMKGYTPMVVDLPEFKILTMTFVQEEDCCGEPDNMEQFCTVDFVDGGGGYYSVISTERWAMAEEEWVPLHTFIEAIVEHNNILDNVVFEVEDCEIIDDTKVDDEIAQGDSIGHINTVVENLNLIEDDNV